MFVARVALACAAVAGAYAPAPRAAVPGRRRLGVRFAEIVAPSPAWEARTRARVDALRQRLTADRMELEELERRLVCCAPPEPPPDDRRAAARLVDALRTSAGVKLAASPCFFFFTGLVGPQVFQRRFRASPDPAAFVANETSAGLRILGGLALLPSGERRSRLATLRRHAPLLVVHAPGILSRLDRLERFVPGIVTRILDGDHLVAIEPHLDAILDRFDDVEPHVPWVLDNIDALAPHVGALMRHLDELLLYADEEYRWADDFLPYLRRSL